MLREEREWNHRKCLRQQKAEWKTKRRTKNKGHKQKTVTNMVNINSAVSIITLNVNDLRTPAKGRLSEWVKKQDLTLCRLQETYFKYEDIYRHSACSFNSAALHTSKFAKGKYMLWFFFHI